MNVIGLTGNSGAGKGAVAKIMSNNGALVLDCDKIAHSNMEPEGVAYNEIIKAFGNTIVNGDNTINRKALGSIVFNNSEKLALLNKITHKYIEEVVLKALAENKDRKCIVIDAPLLFEAGLNNVCDSVWAVDAPEELRAERVMTRDNIDRESALIRFKNQSNFSQIANKCNVIIVNKASVEELEKEVSELMESNGLV